MVSTLIAWRRGKRAFSYAPPAAEDIGTDCECLWHQSPAARSRRRGCRL